MQQGTDYKAHALHYASLGFAVHPVKAGGKNPLLSEWQIKATTNQKIIANWWDKKPTANIGIHAGKSNLVILDIDPRNGGLESFERLKDAMGSHNWISPFQVESGGGGLHFYYAANSLSDLRNLNLGSGIDLIYGNKYIIAPPSVHPSGGVYKWQV